MTEFETGKDGEMDDLGSGRSPLKAHWPNWRGKEIMDSEFRNIVSDEMEKIKYSSSNDPLAFSTNNVDDTLREYDGPNQAHRLTESKFGLFDEELLIEMDKVFQCNTTS